MKTIKIREPFYGAGSPKIYNWVKDGFDMKGIGLKTSLLNENETLTVHFEGKDHILKCEDAKKFIENYGSLKTARGTTLGVVSTSLFTEVYDD